MSDVEFERRVAAALRGDVSPDAHARARIMARVRDAAREAPRRPDRFFARGARHSVFGLALAAGIGSVTTLSTLLPSRADGGPGSVVIGDTVVATLRDTLRLVRLMFDAPAAAHVIVVGNFHGRGADSTPLARHPQTGRWSVTFALQDGAYRYAFVVDGTRWAPDARAEQVRADDGRLYSLLNVARATN